MPFDPSVIGSIGDSAPDVAGSIGRAYKLKDMVTSNEMNALELSEKRRDVANRQKLETVLRGVDWSSPESRMDAVSKVAKNVGGVEAMKLSSEISAMERDQLAVKQKKLEIQSKLDQMPIDKLKMYTERVDAFMSPMTGVVEQYDDLIAKGAPPSQAIKAVQPAYVSALVSMQQSGIFNTPEDAQQFQKLGAQFDPSKIKNMLSQSREMRKELADADKRRQQTSLEERRLSLEERRTAAIEKKTDAAGFAPDEKDLLGSMALLGISIPSGRSAAQLKASLRGMLDANPGKSGAEIAQMVKEGKIAFNVENKERTTAAGIAGRVAVGENELLAFAPPALAISEKVPRGKFKPFNQLVQIGEANLSDPDLKELYGRTKAILNAYDVVTARGGTDKEKRAENRKVLETADSPEAYRRALETIIDEAKKAKSSARDAERGDKPAGDKTQDPLGIR